jgi:enoyl-CoA hydratase/carnithine racemase
MLIDKGIESSVATALSLERATLKMMVNSEDYQEAVSAMAKKRKPDYKQK